MPTCFDTVRCEIRSAAYAQASPHTPILYTYHSSLRPELEFYATPEEVQNWRDCLYLGVELESDSRSSLTAQYHNKLNTISDCCKIMQSDTYGYFMRDGSIRGGMEFITQPSTYNFYEANRAVFGALFECIKEHGFSADKLSTTGFHIHFNRDFYLDNEKQYLENLLFAIDRYWPYLVYCSKRPVSSISRWSKKYITEPKEIVEQMYQGRLPDRYHVLNVRNKNTFEFRLWHGTLDIHSFYAILTLVRNLVTMAKSKTMDEISSIPFEFLITNGEMANYWISASRRQATRKYDSFLSR